MREGLTFDDVLIEPKRSPIDSRSDVELKTEIGDIELTNPIISSPMDTVTEDEMAIAMAEEGGLGIIHRYQSINEQVNQVEKVKDENLPVGAAIGVDEGEMGTSFLNRAKQLVNVGVDAICIDVAHGHLDKVIEATEMISDDEPNVTLIVGNVATRVGVRDLTHAGADVIRIGIGNGSHCTTRKVTGVGVPQVSALQEANSAISYLKREAKLDDNKSFTPPDIISDGGVKQPGDAAKALLLGADAVMVGGELAVREESAARSVEDDSGREVKITRGQSTIGSGATEGISKRKGVQGSVFDLIKEYREGLQSTVSYVGGENLQEAKENVEFWKVTPSTQKRNGGF